MIVISDSGISRKYKGGRAATSLGIKLTGILTIGQLMFANSGRTGRALRRLRRRLASLRLLYPYTRQVERDSVVDEGGDALAATEVVGLH